MKIGLVTNLMDSHTGGISRYTKNLVENLLRLDRENEYVLIHSNRKKCQLSGKYKEIQLPFFTSIPHKFITGLLYLDKICKDEKLDILHDTGQIGPYFWPSKTKRILTIFDVSIYRYPEVFTTLTRLYYRSMNRVTKNIDKIITISKYSKNDIIKFLHVSPNKVSVTHLGVEKHFCKIKNPALLDQVRKKLHLPNSFVLFVGTIEPRKNIPFLIKAFAKVKEDLPKETKLVIAGRKGWERKDTYSLPSLLGIENDVIFTGQIEDTYLPALYNLADVFVYPSLYEGFGLPVLEAMACRCPVITSNVSSLPEIAGKGALLINPANENELAKKIKDVIINQKIRENLIHSGFIQSEKFSWETCALQTLNIYKNVI